MLEEDKIKQQPQNSASMNAHKSNLRSQQQSIKNKQMEK